jgi:hypothetical protein
MTDTDARSELIAVVRRAQEIDGCDSILSG